MKERLQKLFAGRTARILLAAAAAALLLLLCFAVFGGTQGAAETGGYAETAEEVRLSALLSRIEGAGQVDAAITEEDGVPVRAVVFFDVALDLAEVDLAALLRAVVLLAGLA